MLCNKVVLITILSCFMTTANAAAVYYTFTGEIDQFENTEGLLTSSGLSIGSEVSYTWLIDTDLDGTYAVRSGGLVTPVDGAYYRFGTLYERDYFYAELISPGYIQSNGISLSGSLSGSAIDYDYGVEDTGSGNKVNLYNGSVSSEDNLYTRQLLANWDVGDVGFYITENAALGGGTNSYDSIRAYLTLSDISTSNPLAPVPLPATAWLFGSGLLGLVGVARRKKA